MAREYKKGDLLMAVMDCSDGRFKRGDTLTVERRRKSGNLDVFVKGDFSRTFIAALNEIEPYSHGSLTLLGGTMGEPSNDFAKMICMASGAFGKVGVHLTWAGTILAAIYLVLIKSELLTLF